MTVLDNGLFEGRRDFSTFRELGEVHTLRALAYASGDGDRYRVLFGEARQLENELGLRLREVGDTPSPWRSSSGTSAGDARKWRAAYLEGSLPAQGEIFTGPLVGLRLGASAALAYERLESTSIGPSPFRTTNESRLYLRQAAQTLVNRKEIAEALQIGSSGRPGALEAEVATQRRELSLFGSQAWSQWVAHYDRGAPLTWGALDLDLHRGVTRLLTEPPISRCPTEDAAPEALCAFVRWQGSVMNRQEMLNGENLAANIPASTDFDAKMLRVHREALEDAVQRTGMPFPQEAVTRESSKPLEAPEL